MTRQCNECGSTFTPKRSSARFCGSACRKAYNNRRMTRGAVLYDAFMALRFDRAAADEAGLDYKTVCRIGEMFRNEDVRAGRDAVPPAKDFMHEHRAEINARQGRV